jgi:hypothetical protein
MNECCVLPRHITGPVAYCSELHRLKDMFAHLQLHQRIDEHLKFLHLSMRQHYFNTHPQEIESDVVPTPVEKKNQNWMSIKKLKKTTKPKSKIEQLMFE